MNDFFNSLRFKILVAVLMLMLGFIVAAVYTGGSASLVQQAISFITVPAQRLSSRIAGDASEFFDRYLNAGTTYEENIRLQAELNELRRKLVEYEQVKHENEQFREFLGMRETLQDMELEIAFVIARDPNDRFYSFTIDKGTRNGVSVLDPVLTADGLVGYVSEVGMNHAKVVTILDVAVDVGAYSSSTRDMGIVSGTIDLAAEGLCLLEYLPRESKVAVGDVILTGGGSLFPRDQLVGEVVAVGPNRHGTSLAAAIKPYADIRNVKDVFVITSFDGQGTN